MTTERNEQEILREKQIDAAFTTYPLASLPPAFTSRLMGQIETTPQTEPSATRSPSLPRYLRLYSFELACATTLTLVMMAGIGWPLLVYVGLLPIPHTPLTALLTQPSSVWYAFGFCGLILLELVIAFLAWVAWVEQPQIKVR
jgi:hypothetical protein